MSRASRKPRVPGHTARPATSSPSTTSPSLRSGASARSDCATRSMPRPSASSAHPVPRGADTHGVRDQGRAGDQGISSASRCTPTPAGTASGRTLVADAMHWLWRQGVDPLVREHAARERRGARAVRVVRLPRPPRPGSRCWGAHCETGVSQSRSSPLIVVGERRRGMSRRSPRRPTAPTPLVLASQDAWTSNSGTFTMSLKTGGNTEGLQITLTVHDRLCRGARSMPPSATARRFRRP